MTRATPPDFQQIGASAAYALPPGSGHGWCGYVLPKGSSNLPSSLSLADAFNQNGGHYLFAPQAPAALLADPAAFAEALYTLLFNVGNRRFVGRALLWLAKGKLPAATQFDQTGLRISLETPCQVQNNYNLALGRQLTFAISNGTFVSYDDATASLRLKSSNIGRSLGWSDRRRAPCGLSLLPDDRPLAFIGFTGDHAGALAFNLKYTSADALAYFNTGFAYIVGGLGGDNVMEYPVFEAARMPASLTLAGTLDPLDTLNQALTLPQLQAGRVRSGFAFTGPTGLVLPSHWRTSAGQAIAMAPCIALGDDGWPLPYAPSLVFSDTGSSFDMTLAGDFALQVAAVPGGTPGQRLLCGIFGTEWLQFTSYDSTQPSAANDRLRLLPAQPAYAPVFPFTPSTLVQPTSGKLGTLLDNRQRTAWASLVGGAYSAQPAGSPLYGNGQGSGTAMLLSPTAPRTPLPDGLAFPMVPYAGVGAAGNLDLTQFESQIIAACRKQRVADATQPHKALARSQRLQRRARAPAGALPRATTPQGLLVDLDDDGATYARVLLARSRPGLEPLDFAFVQPTTLLQEALQTNQLFMVAVNPVPFTRDGASFLNRMEIADWRFLANIGSGAQTTSYRNVLIMKYCSGSLKERIDNPNRWTQPQAFSLVENTPSGQQDLALTGLSQWLQDFVADAQARAEEPESLYADFVKRVNDPDWNGFLVLQADLPLDSLPDQLAGIAAGIDYSRFLAHHFGASVSRVTQQGDSLDVVGISNLFGLVDYQNAAYVQARANGAGADMPVALQTQNGYAFSVLQLQVLFRQSRLQHFNSRIQLSLDNLFGTPIQGTRRAEQASPVNAMVLDGSAVQQDATTTYVFEQTQRYLLNLDSNVLPATAISRIQFNTLGSPDGGQTTASRFLLWGNLDFAELATTDGPFDLLSFGSQGTAHSGAGLAFTNLQIGMAFPTATPNAVTFNFDPANLGFDLTASQPREQSLYKGFNLQLKQFIQAPAEKKPADYGFLPVLPQGLALKALSGAWNAVVYKVTMGSPGALVSGAGFESDLLLAWAPGSRASDTSPALFVGLSLPGAAPGASVFSLQGIIKVSTGPIQLLYQAVPGGAEGDRFFNLKLTDIGIKILGIAKLPPGATLQFFLFGDPKQSGSLGWYAAYVKDQAAPKTLLQALPPAAQATPPREIAP